MDLLLISVMWIFATFITVVLSAIGITVILLVYMVGKLFRENDPHTFENDEDP